MRVPPPVGADLRAWAEDIRRYLARYASALQWKDAGAKAQQDGILLWDETLNKPVVSIGGVFVPLATEPALLRVYMHVDAVDNLTLSAQPLAADFLNASSRVIQLADLAGYTEVRISARVRVNSASPNSPRVYGVYANTFTTTVANYAELAATGSVQCSLATAGVAQSAWVPLASGAAADGKFLAVLMAGGDGIASPSLGYVMLEFR